MKKCAKCNSMKDFNEFNKCKTGRLGLHNHCRVCQKEVKYQWYLKNRESELKKGKIYSKSEIAKERRQKYYIKYKDKILKKNRLRRRTPHARKLANIARRKIYNSNISFRLSVNLRSRIRAAIKGHNKSKSSIQLLGCTIDFFKEYLEKKFISGMTWDNYGYYGWHIDHIIPCNSFDLSKPEEQIKCFHYTNLQPLWWNENLSKGNKNPQN